MRQLNNSLLLILVFCATMANAQWTQVGQTIYGTNDSEWVGDDVEISADGNTIIVGARQGWNTSSVKTGWVKVFTYNGTNWVQKGQTLYGVNLYDDFGRGSSINASGDTIVVGALSYGSDGMTKVFYYNGSSWTQLGVDFTAELAGDRIGSGVSLSDNGRRMALGAYGNDGGGSNSGHVRVFEWTGSVWNQIGQDIDGIAANDWTGFFHTLSGDGSTVIVDGYRNDGIGTDVGRAAVYRYNGSSWVQMGPDFLGDATDERFGTGTSISKNGNIVAIGAPQNGSTNTDTGYVRIYEWNGVQWNQLGATIKGIATEQFGYDVSLSEDGYKVAIGGPYGTGRIRVYNYVGGNWIQQGNDIIGAGGIRLAGAIEMTPDGNRIVAGAVADHTGGNFAGSAWVYEWTCLATTATINPSACTSYTSPSGNYTWTTSNTYTDTIQNVGGCDSIITVNLTITGPSNGTDVLTSCDSLQWIDGNTYYSNNNTATHTIVNGAASGCDSIVTLNLTINTASTGTDVITACDSYTWIDNNTYTSNNTTVTHTIINGAVSGCDSVVTLNLTINTVDNTTTSNNDSIMANAGSASYQWLDCDNNYAVIPGATSQLFVAAANGNYAVEVTQNSCIDTSACVTVSSVGIDEDVQGQSLKVYPNPTNGLFTIEWLNNGTQTVDLSIINVTGKIIGEWSFKNRIEMDLSKQAKGIYYIRISTSETIITKRLVIQ